ncbi:MAG: hypothetical protein ACYS5W_10150, partial [Planctomycetota bacterium]
KLEILPIEVTNRTVTQDLDAARARRVKRHDMLRVELPDGGRVFQYRRNGGAQHGFFLITPRGQAVVLLELAGVGLSGTDTPFLDRIGVAPDGRHAAFATLAGQLYIARLDGQAYPSSKAPARPVKIAAVVEKVSLCVGKSQLFFQTADHKLWRCPLADNGQPTDMTPTGTGELRLKEEMALSGDGDRVVFLFGPKKLYSLYMLRSTGPLVKLSPKASKYEEPGYLPEFRGGTRLMLNHDGSRLLYVDSTVRDEIFLLDTSTSGVNYHVTSNANFQPYIGIGIVPMFAQTTLTIGVGNADAHDLYRVTTTATNVVNLTGTAVELKPPFGAGKLAPESGYQSPTGMVLTSLKQANLPSLVRRIDTKTKAANTVTSTLRGVMATGDALAGTPTILVPGGGGDTFVDSTTLKTILPGPPGVFLTPEVQGQGGAFTVFIASDHTGITVPVIRIVNGPLMILAPEKTLRQIVLTRAGGGLLNGASLRYLSPSKNVLVSSSAKVRLVISGAGG